MCHIPVVQACFWYISDTFLAQFWHIFDLLQSVANSGNIAGAMPKGFWAWRSRGFWALAESAFARSRVAEVTARKEEKVRNSSSKTQRPHTWRVGNNEISECRSFCGNGGLETFHRELRQ